MPHITDAIQEWVERVARISVDNDTAEPDICIIEVSREHESALHNNICRIAWWYDR